MQDKPAYQFLEYQTDSWQTKVQKISLNIEKKTVVYLPLEMLLKAYMHDHDVDGKEDNWRIKDLQVDCNKDDST